MLRQKDHMQRLLQRLYCWWWATEVSGVMKPVAFVSPCSLQDGRTVENPVTCGRWAWCSSPCSMASSPSTTAYLRSFSAKSRLLSTPSLSEYSLSRGGFSLSACAGGALGCTGTAGAGGASIKAPEGRSSNETKDCVQ